MRLIYVSSLEGDRCRIRRRSLINKPWQTGFRQICLGEGSEIFLEARPWPRRQNFYGLGLEGPDLDLSLDLESCIDKLKQDGNKLIIVIITD